MQSVAGSNLWLILTALAMLVLGMRFHVMVLVVLLGLGAGAAALIYRVLNTEEPNLGDAIALTLVGAGCLAAAIPEVVYLRDVFDGSASYRMNTVFKFDYEAWLLLGLAAAYGVYRTWSIVRTHFAPALGWGILAVAAIGTVMGLGYTWNAPQSADANALGGTAVGSGRAVPGQDLVSGRLCNDRVAAGSREAGNNRTRGDQDDAAHGRVQPGSSRASRRFPVSRR